jgi:tetratricopeptide (TPR) repeat protein
MRRLTIFLLALASAAGAQPAGHDGDAGHGDQIHAATPQILAGYGKGGFPIRTASPQAQAFFDNGMQLAHAFAHKAAVEAMAEAVRLDPTCAMCLWGQAWASGPTINYGKTANELKPLHKMAKQAAKLARKGRDARETMLTEALVRRYENGGGGKPGDVAFAEAMQALAERYPEDNEIATIAADAWLIAAPPGPGKDRQAGLRAMPLLEAVLKRDPDYTPAIHFYIHATEVAGVPAKAEAAADRLIALAPNASHLVHMPSHTWYWVGRYQDAADANVKAVEIGKANARRLRMPEPDGVWGLPYHSHNVVFGLGGAMMAGDAKTALLLGRPLVEMSQKRSEAPAFSQMLAAAGYYALARFAEPGEVLALPEPRLPYLKAAWHYARGEAEARRGNGPATLAEAAAIPERIATPKPKDPPFAAVPEQMLTITRHVLQGRAAMLAGKPAEALPHFQAAAAAQETEPFSRVADPPAFWYPVRRSVAEARLAMGDAAGALREADASLKLRPRDPEALRLREKAQAAMR